MEKIKGSEVLKDFKYLAIDKDGFKRIFSRMPSIVGDEFRIEGFDPRLDMVYTIGNVYEGENWKESLREIDHSENKEPNSIFKIDDTVHILSCSNIGEFGKSTEGVIRAIYKDGTILVKVEEGIEEVHNEDNVSFTPFSIKEAGFSQVRPIQEPMVGDWGFFYNQKPAKSFCYHKLYSMGNLKKVRMGVDYPFTTDGGTFYKYFSHTPPQLAADIPNPFAQC